ncbi:DUF3558 domain-containing protein [Streptomyces sp. A3M-1-3]|uniref:DUF3558 domain-containing protein n=1 Tax=Streptomyces sp. A3M-1-3 TaxID=2962044 RepID=UPI0020B6B048|nr:DUF3558 domain-containing protein [Streptomyces sp. A3M-1-3]MCP3822115.1 DUF3558 domain-containing protein [Streptomyces sp. A3M-1-3]
MQRKAYVPGIALLAALVAGCTGGSGTDDTPVDSKPGGTTVAAPPGKYRTLPEPCGSIERDRLKGMLPGAEELTPEQQDQAYQGRADATHDGDRRVGCHWKVESADATRHLFVGFERVVSYDRAVSDDDKAQEVYEKKVAAADIAKTVDPRDDLGKNGTQSPSGTAPNGSATTAKPPSSQSPAQTPPQNPTQTPGEGLEPRLLEGLGGDAFLDDRLATAGSTSQSRTVTVVFRTSNVIVTVEYAEQPALAAAVPDSENMQDKAQALARKLSEQFDE